MFWKPLTIFGALAIWILPSERSFAHPHLWIDATATVQFDQDRVTGIRFQWTFDEFFSAGVIGEFDRNNNKSFDADEIEPLRIGAFEGTKEVGFFTDIQFGTDKFDIQTTTDFAARIQKGVVVYDFTVPFPDPVDPTVLSFSLFDASYFVDISFQGHDPVKLAGDGPANCTISIADDRLNPIFGGVVFPQKVQLQCPKPR